MCGYLCNGAAPLLHLCGLAHNQRSADVLYGGHPLSFARWYVIDSSIVYDTAGSTIVTFYNYAHPTLLI